MVIGSLCPERKPVGVGGPILLKIGTQLSIIINKRNVGCLISGACMSVQCALGQDIYSAEREYKKRKPLLFRPSCHVSHMAHIEASHW